MIRVLPLLLLLASTTGCGRTPRPTEPAASALQVLERARVRPTPDPVRARLHLKLDSGPMDLSAGTGGVYITDRPGRGHLAVLGPLGGPVATVTSDGAGLAVAMPRDRKLMAALDAEASLRQATGGMFGLDDLVGLVLGDLPFDEAEVLSRTPLADGGERVILQGPSAAQLEVELEPEHATPRNLSVREQTGRTLLVAVFDPFEAHPQGTLVPTKVKLEVPPLAIHLELRFKSWELLDEVPPVFDLSAPEGWTVEPLEWSLFQPAATFIRPPDEHP